MLVFYAALLAVTARFHLLPPGIEVHALLVGLNVPSVLVVTKFVAPLRVLDELMLVVKLLQELGPGLEGLCPVSVWSVFFAPDFG